MYVCICRTAWRTLGLQELTKRFTGGLRVLICVPRYHTLEAQMRQRLQAAGLGEVQVRHTALSSLTAVLIEALSMLAIG